MNVRRATELVKEIVACNRCGVCDNLFGKRVRYPCGCTSCVVCVPATESCPFCLTPPNATSINIPFPLDGPLTLRSENAQNLLNAFQTCFDINVENNEKASEKLKVEKDIFPKCIQAPVKYYNKRKSTKTSIENKENIAFFPGEEVSMKKMENSNANVRKWLDNCVRRKPLGDLNNSVTNKRQPLKTLNTQNVLNRSLIKRKISEIWNDENETYIEDFHGTPAKRSKVKLQNVVKSSIIKNSKKDDSGISIHEDDSIVVIDDSQSIRVDKDANALLAVLEAEKNALHSNTQDSNCIQSDKIPQHNLKVPFYKRSSLAGSCYNCKEYYRAVNTHKSEQPNVSITVESKSFTTIISISKANETNIESSKKSVTVQTDDNTKTEMFHDRTKIDNDNTSISDDIFMGENINESAGISANRASNVIIAESDSDEDLEHSMSLEVAAEIHRSFDEKILEDVKNLQEHSKRPRRSARGYTPTSTDSSEKENYNPNRKKKPTQTKKKPAKK